MLGEGRQSGQPAERRSEETARSPRSAALTQAKAPPAGESASLQQCRRPSQGKQRSRSKAKRRHLIPSLCCFFTVRCTEYPELVRRAVPSLRSQLLRGQPWGSPSFKSYDASLPTPDSVSLKLWHFQSRHAGFLTQMVHLLQIFSDFSPLRLMGLFTTLKLSIKMVLRGYSRLLSAPVLLPHGIGCL